MHKRNSYSTAQAFLLLLSVIITLSTWPSNKTWVVGRTKRLSNHTPIGTTINVWMPQIAIYTTSIDLRYSTGLCTSIEFRIATVWDFKVTDVATLDNVDGGLIRSLETNLCARIFRQEGGSCP